MLTGNEFVAKIKKENQALFKASQINVKAYFDSKPAQEELVEHFIGRMVNERMNMVEIAQSIAAMPASTSAEELALLTKQAYDEANHFRMVRDVIEHITGETLDVEAAIAAEAAKPTAKGAALLAKYEAETDPVALAAYQLVAEGRAEAVWDQMAECVEDEFISRTYAKIARDEGFHANIGGMKLAQLVNTAEQQAAVESLVDKMRKDLFDISCKNTREVSAAKELVEEAYGW
jgi:rubrerythrin